MDIEVNKILDTDIRTLSRMISMIENLESDAFDILSKLDNHSGQAITIGITGAPGAGKSTLVNQLITEIRKLGKSVAVLAVDPSSPLSGGAILGDRIRMGSQYRDDSVFIRSLSSHGESGGIPMILGSMIRLLDVAKYDFILIETVGVGQTEFKIMNFSDVVVVVLTPESGDSIQMIKAGLMEIADLYVVNKSDRPGSDRLVADINATLHPQDTVPTGLPRTLKTEALTGKGIPKLLEVLYAYHEHMKSTGNLIQKKETQRSNETLEIIKYLSLSYIDEFIQATPEFQIILENAKTKLTDPYTSSQLIMKKFKDIVEGE